MYLEKVAQPIARKLELHGRRSGPLAWTLTFLLLVPMLVLFPMDLLLILAQLVGLGGLILWAGAVLLGRNFRDNTANTVMATVAVMMLVLAGGVFIHAKVQDAKFAEQMAIWAAEDAAYQERMEEILASAPVFRPRLEVAVTEEAGSQPEVTGDETTGNVGSELTVPMGESVQSDKYAVEPTVRFRLPDEVIINGERLSAAQVRNLRTTLEDWTRRGYCLDFASSMGSQNYVEGSLWPMPTPGQDNYWGWFQIRQYNGDQMTQKYRVFHNNYVDRGTIRVQNDFIDDMLHGVSVNGRPFDWARALSWHWGPNENNLGALRDDMLAAPNAGEMARIFNERFLVGSNGDLRVRVANEIRALIIEVDGQK
ncbi:hypothetical protein FWH13_02190 [Candidatus Saccharibacteria bacterium]|nr:hypothetical protein [Candidatus Saccharibacteria bacterium]